MALRPSLPGLLAALALSTPAALAQDAETPATQSELTAAERLQQLEGQVGGLLQAFEALTRENQRLSEELAALQGDMLGAGDEFYIPRAAAEFDETDLAPAWATSTPSRS